MAEPADLKQQLKEAALQLGFDAVGIAPAVPPPHYDFFRRWLQHGYHGQMQYMARWADARGQLDRVLPGTRSVVVVLKSYNDQQRDESDAWADARISRYARRPDYHRVLKGLLRRLGDELRRLVPEAQCRAVVDTAPLLERDYGWLAGLGWIGKNTMLIHRKLGSWVFIGALLTTADIEPDDPFPTDHCGTCTRCLDVCPTDALLEPYVLDARRCISYLTIELRGALAPEDRDRLHGWLFGCDLCQEVCPWNRRALSPRVDLLPRDARLDRLTDPVAVLELDDESLDQLIRETPLERAGVEGLKRNAALLLAQRRDGRAERALKRALAHRSEVVRDAARWALERWAEKQKARDGTEELMAGERCH